jgi:hypothetical protein
MTHADALAEWIDRHMPDALARDELATLVNRVVYERTRDANDLAESSVRWFGFSDRKRILWGVDYNQAARDLYERACKHVGRIPLPKDQPKSNNQ